MVALVAEGGAALILSFGQIGGGLNFSVNLTVCGIAIVRKRQPDRFEQAGWMVGRMARREYLSITISNAVT